MNDESGGAVLALLIIGGIMVGLIQAISATQ